MDIGEIIPFIIAAIWLVVSFLNTRKKMNKNRPGQGKRDQGQPPPSPFEGFDWETAEEEAEVEVDEKQEQLREQKRQVEERLDRQKRQEEQRTPQPTVADYAEAARESQKQWERQHPTVDEQTRKRAEQLQKGLQPRSRRSQRKEVSMNEIVDDFDPVKAVVWSEILKRPEW